MIAGSMIVTKLTQSRDNPLLRHVTLHVPQQSANKKVATSGLLRMKFDKNDISSMFFFSKYSRSQIMSKNVCYRIFNTTISDLTKSRNGAAAVPTPVVVKVAPSPK